MTLLLLSGCATQSAEKTYRQITMEEAILAGNGFDCYNFSGGFRFYDAVTNDRCLIESATACGMDRA